jgi:serine/threonine protein kinase
MLPTHAGTYIIHSDIKPANVIFTTNYDVTKLSDLSISKAKRLEPTLTTAQKQALPITPHYMYLAPDVLLSGSKTNTCSNVLTSGHWDVHSWNYSQNMNVGLIVIFVASCT